MRSNSSEYACALHYIFYTKARTSVRKGVWHSLHSQLVSIEGEKYVAINDVAVRLGN